MKRNIFPSVIIGILALLLVTVSALFITVTLRDGPSEEPVTSEPRPARVRGRVYDDYGNMTAAGIIIEDEDGKRTRVNTNYLSGYTLRLPEGRYTLHFTRGMQYSVVTEEIEVENFKTYWLNDVRLVRLFDSRDYGYYPGDTHHHSTHSDGADDVDQVLLSHITNGMYYGFLTDHNTASGLPEWMQGDRFAADLTPGGDPVWFQPFMGVEVTTTRWGHYNTLGTGIVIPEWDIDPSKGDVPIEEVAYIAQEIKRSGGIASIQHPFSGADLGFPFWEILDEFDVLEIWNGVYHPHSRENTLAREKWYELLNEGRFFPAVGGSDCHSVASSYDPSWLPANPTEEDLYRDEFLKMGRYTGMPAYYAKIEGELTFETLSEAFLGGHGFLSNGILLFADIEGAEYGESFILDPSGEATMELTAFSREGIDVIRIIVNGMVHEELDMDGAPEFEGVIEIEGLTSGDWIVLEAEGPMARYAITNPIFID